jgi:transcriptional regulator NrdR family protein
MNMALKCPTCSTRGYVIETRTRADNALNRRYRCGSKKCKVRWSTSELIVKVDADGKNTKSGGRQLRKVLAEKMRKEAQDDMRRDLRTLLGFQR